MEENKYAIVLITSSAEEASNLADALLIQRKAACVNVITTANSTFWWQGQIESVQESILIVKTKTSLVDEIIKIIKEIHSYDVPEVISLPIIGGNKDYLDWIDKELG